MQGVPHNFTFHYEALSLINCLDFFGLSVTVYILFCFVIGAATFGSVFVIWVLVWSTLLGVGGLSLHSKEYVTEFAPAPLKGFFQRLTNGNHGTSFSVFVHWRWPRQVTVESTSHRDRCPKRVLCRWSLWCCACWLWACGLDVWNKVTCSLPRWWREWGLNFWSPSIFIGNAHIMFLCVWVLQLLFYSLSSLVTLLSSQLTQLHSCSCSKFCLAVLKLCWVHCCAKRFWLHLSCWIWSCSFTITLGTDGFLSKIQVNLIVLTTEIVKCVLADPIKFQVTSRLKKEPAVKKPLWQVFHLLVTFQKKLWWQRILFKSFSIHANNLAMSLRHLQLCLCPCFGHLCSLSNFMDSWIMRCWITFTLRLFWFQHRLFVMYFWQFETMYSQGLDIEWTSPRSVWQVEWEKHRRMGLEEVPEAERHCHWSYKNLIWWFYDTSTMVTLQAQETWQLHIDSQCSSKQEQLDCILWCKIQLQCLCCLPLLCLLWLGLSLPSCSLTRSSSFGWLTIKIKTQTGLILQKVPQLVRSTQSLMPNFSGSKCSWFPKDAFCSELDYSAQKNRSKSTQKSWSVGFCWKLGTNWTNLRWRRQGRGCWFVWNMVASWDWSWR